MKIKFIYKEDIWKIIVVFFMLLFGGLLTSHIKGSMVYGSSPFMFMWIMIAFPIAITLRYYSIKHERKKFMENKIETPIEYCPHCNANLRGDPIPEDIAHQYSGTHWIRKIGIYDFRLDRIIEYECPNCQGRWKREN